MLNEITLDEAISAAKDICEHISEWEQSFIAADNLFCKNNQSGTINAVVPLDSGNISTTANGWLRDSAETRLHTSYPTALVACFPATMGLDSGTNDQLTNSNLLPLGSDRGSGNGVVEELLQKQVRTLNLRVRYDVAQLF